MFKEFIEIAKTEGQMIKNAPFAFSICVIISFSVLWYILNWHYAGIIQQKDAANQAGVSEIEAIKADRDSFKNDNERLARDNQQLRTYRGKDAPPLKQNALTLAAQIHAYIKNWKDTDVQNLQYQNVRKYVERFGLRASLMRDDLDQNGQDLPDFDKVMYNFQGSYKEVGTIADSIEKLANNLPD